MKRKQKWDHSDIAVLVIVVLTLVGVLIGPVLMGATVYTRESWGNAETDSVIVVRRDMSDNSLLDSTDFGTAIHTFPFETTFTWDDTKDYSYFIKNHFGTDGWFADVTQWKKFTGAAASIDYGRIYDTVAAAVSDSILGAGPYAVTFTVYDSTNSAPVLGAHVTVKNQAQTAIVARTLDGGTDDNGDFTAGLESVWVKVITRATGFIFTIVNDSFFIDSTEVDTIFGYAFIPSAPTGDSTCTVYGWIVDDPSDTVSKVEGKIVTFMTANDVFDICNNKAILNTSTSDYTDSMGYFEKELTFSSCLALYGDTIAPTTPIQYTVDIQDGKQGYIITVPDSATYRITWR